MNQLKLKNQFDQIPIQVHPRVFDALGADLVTNDIVAVIELVKNAYDAFACNVWLSFEHDPIQGDYLEIKDDGHGMLRKTIENTWCTIATPNKQRHPYVESGDGHKRRVSGEKGLGRLSAARLGTRLDMLTKYQGNPCWEVKIDWRIIASGDDISQSFVQLRELSNTPPFETGTRLRIFELKRKWDRRRKDDLRENLGRLVSPYDFNDEFNIYFSDSPDKKSESIVIQSPKFLSYPKYRFYGDVDKQGNVYGTYQFRPIGQEIQKCENENIQWTHIHRGLSDPIQVQHQPDPASCGPFSFEIRAWDIGPDDQEEIATGFEINKKNIRRVISHHKGISVYRDNVLMLPKTDSDRDWLGLDLRRISKIGPRLSTSQIVGYVQISAAENPNIRDTSDREQLADSKEVDEFKAILKAIIQRLERKRSKDRHTDALEKPISSLFEEISADNLLENIRSLSVKSPKIVEILPVITKFKSSLDERVHTIQQRFIYYSRLATIGSIAEMLIHEVRGRTTVFGRFIKFVQKKLLPSADVTTEIKYASDATDALDRLADTFAPLASRRFRRRLRKTILEDRINVCITLMQDEITAKQVDCNILTSTTPVAVDPGELDAILLNLISNSLYWLSDIPKDQRKIEFVIDHSTPNQQRVTISLYDTGPGVAKEYLDKVFWPGVTLKPSGIGMGLTVASELVASYDGRMYTKELGKKNGAVFGFDLPLRL